MTPDLGIARLADVKALSRLLLVAVLGVAGCSTPGSGTTAAPAAQSSGQPSGQASSAAFGGTDLAWIEINIAMDEQLLPLLELAPKHTTDASTLALTAQVKTFTDAELSVLRQLHARAGLPAENPHEGMPMPGMVTPEQVTELTRLTGPAFDRTTTKLIKAHLEQSRNLARSEDSSGVEPQTRALALQILRSRQAVLSTMPSTAP
ncbi:DUF305 domain-containing protein [Actinoplanes sp. URMC 104]|uniref:DUF305 domain-containing protein n=1 Tax=Actinoplanes sp. URMC 104 TaxID=3423409 RepID=UPI003F1BB008